VKNVVINKQRDVTPFFILQNLATLYVNEVYYIISSLFEMEVPISSKYFHFTSGMYFCSAFKNVNTSLINNSNGLMLGFITVSFSLELHAILLLHVATLCVLRDV
jgi:hypothetical protein